MLPAILTSLFERDLERLQPEIEAYQNEHALWRIAPGIHHSAGNLCLHLLGNLNTYIGAARGPSGYGRDCDLAFSAQHVPRAELRAGIDATRRSVAAALTALPPGQLVRDYPRLVFDAPTSLAYLLVHLTTHLPYHLGQINYHRRLLDTPVQQTT